MNPGPRTPSLTAEEADDAARLLSAAQGVAPALSLNGLLRAWGELVAAVERGYDDSIHEYTNDLAVRDRLARLADAASPALRSKVEAMVEPLDARFALATEASSRPLRGDGERGPWWSVVPRRRVGELADDLAHEGLV